MSSTKKPSAVPGWRPNPGVNDKTGAGSLKGRQIIEGKDLRPCHTEYPLPSASAATSMSCLLWASSCRRSWKMSPRLGAQLLMQAALEAEITEFLGRERYQRGRSLRGRPGRVAEWLPGGNRQDDRRADAAVTAEAARYDPGRSRRGCSGRMRRRRTRWSRW